MIIRSVALFVVLVLRTAHAFVSHSKFHWRNRRHSLSLSKASSSPAVEGFNHDANNAEFDIGVCNIPGVDWQRPNKVNQDRHFVDERSSYTVVGVLDGHGKHGHEVSSFAAKTMPRGISDRLTSSSSSAEKAPRPTEEESNILEFERQSIREFAGFDCDEYRSTLSCSRTQQWALVDSFHAVHYGSIIDESVRAGRSGSTCIVCIIDRDSRECDVAYVGDSRAVRFGPDGSSACSVVATEQTVDVADERRRIESREGSVRGKNVFYGPVGIAMTRALGDAVMARAGVIPTPMVGRFRLDEGDTLVLATDGIWDVLTNEQVRDIASNCANAQDAAEDIASIARERWIGDLPIVDEMKADDITVMVLEC